MHVKGWVYIITNRAMPGLVKVGYSMKDPSLRAAELNHTGNPHPYDVRYECLVKNPRDVEQATHGRLACHREGKEWFRCEIPAAIHQIRNAAGDTLILENSFSGERGLLEQAREKIRELEAKLELVQSKEYLFQEAIDGDDLEWKRCIVRYPGWPTGLLEEFCNEYDLSDLEDALIENPSLDPETISQIVEEAPYENVLIGALNNPTCSAENLAKIAWLSGFGLLGAAEKHPNYSAEAFNTLLHKLSNDDDYEVRGTVAGFKNTPRELLKILATDRDFNVREKVASNPSCPLGTLYLLQGDDCVQVSESAIENPANPVNLARNPAEVQHLKQILQCYSTPTRALRDLANHNNHELRQAIALNPECPQEILVDLSRDTNVGVRIAANETLAKRKQRLSA